MNSLVGSFILLQPLFTFLHLNITQKGKTPTQINATLPRNVYLAVYHAYTYDKEGITFYIFIDVILGDEQQQDITSSMNTVVKDVIPLTTVTGKT